MSDEQVVRDDARLYRSLRPSKGTVARICSGDMNDGVPRMLPASVRNEGGIAGAPGGRDSDGTAIRATGGVSSPVLPAASLCCTRPKSSSLTTSCCVRW